MGDIVLTPAKDRRRSPRLAATFPATVRGIDSNGKRFEHVANISDISHEGLHVALPNAMNVGARMFAVVRMGESDSDPAATLAVRGVVVRKADTPDGRVGHGVHFDRWRFL